MEHANGWCRPALFSRRATAPATAGTWSVPRPGTKGARNGENDGMFMAGAEAGWATGLGAGHGDGDGVGSGRECVGQPVGNHASQTTPAPCQDISRLPRGGWPQPLAFSRPAPSAGVSVANLDPTGSPGGATAASGGLAPGRAAQPDCAHRHRLPAHQRGCHPVYHPARQSSRPTGSQPDHSTDDRRVLQAAANRHQRGALHGAAGSVHPSAPCGSAFQSRHLQSGVTFLP
jgi:hypothetical protein